MEACAAPVCVRCVCWQADNVQRQLRHWKATCAYCAGRVLEEVMCDGWARSIRLALNKQPKQRPYPLSEKPEIEALI